MISDGFPAPAPGGIIASVKCESRMAEIIDFAEIQEARRKARARIPEREHLERALQLMRENLAAVAAELADAPRDAQAELLTRVERLAAMIRYGMHMLGDSVPSPVIGRGLAGGTSGRRADSQNYRR
jgi:hypothetical protein